MNIEEIQVSVDDFHGFDWQSLVAQESERTCEKYQQVFGAAVDNVELMSQKNALALLSALCSMMLDPDSDDQPFKPWFEIAGRRGFIVDDFTDNQIGVLGQLAPDITDPELRARVSDAVWIRKRDFRLAEISVRAYLQSASNLDQSEHRFFFPERVTRAIGLAASLGKGELFNEVIGFIESSIQRHVEIEDWDFAYPQLMELLISYKRGNSTDNASLSAQLAVQLESNEAWFFARNYWELQAKWETLANNQEGTRNARLRVAETYVQESQDAIVKRKPPSYMVAAELLRHAIEALRRAGGTKTRQDEIHKLLLEYQEKSLEEFGRISSDPIDLTEAVRQAVAHVSSKSLSDAIFAIALIHHSPRISEIEEAVKAMYQHSPLLAILASTTSDERGRYIKRRPGIVNDDPAQAKTSLKIEMFGHAVRLRSLYVTGIIDPARRQIIREHHLRLHDLLPFVSDNPFVPPGRELIFAQGFQKGFEGDFVVSTHLLILQIENSLRYVLNQNNVITSSLSSEGLQEDYDINQLLYMSELVDVFGEDILFDLKGLLIEAAGSNLRNRMAHGLVTRNEFFSAEAIYLWWLVLRLCCLPILSAMGETKSAP